MIKEANGNSAQLFVETSLVPEYIQIFSPPPAALTCCECTTSVKPRFTSVKKKLCRFSFHILPRSLEIVGAKRSASREGDGRRQ